MRIQYRTLQLKATISNNGRLPITEKKNAKKSASQLDIPDSFLRALRLCNVGKIRI